MIKKKLSVILGSALGIMGLMLAIGIMEVPASAQENVQANLAYINSATSTTSAAVTLKDYSVNINKSQTQNGFKVTVDKAIASKKNLKVTLKIESDKPFDKVSYENSIFELTYGDGTSFHTNATKKYINDKTMIVTLENSSYKEEYSQKGEMRVDVVFSKYKVNIGMDIPVDFTESFKNDIEKDISGKIPELGYTLNKFESDVMGTRINVTKPEVDRAHNNEEKAYWNSSIILKVGDRMYKTNSRGTYSGKDKVIKSDYEAKSVTYDMVKNEKNLSIIPIVCNITADELDKMYSKDAKKEDSVGKDTINNVKYDKNFEFADGSKGEIYNIERNDSNIKVYCKGQSEKESLLMACNMNMRYKYVKGKEDNVFYNSNNVSFYKDPKDSLGYIVEFGNVEKDKEADISFGELIKQADKYKLEDEINLAK